MIKSTVVTVQSILEQMRAGDVEASLAFAAFLIDKYQKKDLDNLMVYAALELMSFQLNMSDVKIANLVEDASRKDDLVEAYDLQKASFLLLNAIKTAVVLQEKMDLQEPSGFNKVDAAIRMHGERIAALDSGSTFLEDAEIERDLIKPGLELFALKLMFVEYQQALEAIKSEYLDDELFKQRLAFVNSALKTLESELELDEKQALMMETAGLIQQTEASDPKELSFLERIGDLFMRIFANQDYIDAVDKKRALGEEFVSYKQSYQKAIPSQEVDTKSDASNTTQKKGGG